MIIEKVPLPDDSSPSDAPPSYDTLAASSSSGAEPRPTYGQATAPAGPSSEKSNVTPAYAYSYGAVQSRPIKVPSGKRSKSGWLSGLFSGAAQTDRDIKKTVLGLIREMVKFESPDSLSILQSCAEACRTRDLSLESILQEKSIEGHTPLYWAIIKRPENAPVNEALALIDVLLSFPLTEDTRAEARQACLLTSDNDLFQHLRASPGFSPTSGADDILNLGKKGPDIVKVTNESKNAESGAFSAEFDINNFQRRIRVAKSIRVEFIARGRSWALEFIVVEAGNQYFQNYKTGTWIVVLQLLDGSPSTWIDSRVTIEDALWKPPLGNSTPPPTLPWQKSSPKPPVVVRLKTNNNDLTSYNYNIKPSSPNSDCIIGTVEGLEFDGSSYIREDGSLHVVFEATLSRTTGGGECIIC